MSQAEKDVCPKCGKDKPAGAGACPRCGLVFALWNPDTAETVKPLDPQAEALWKDTIAGWTIDETHDAFLKYCSVAGQLAAAGRLYRDRLEADAADEIARRMQKRVLGMAGVMLGEPSRPPPSSFMRSGTFFAILIGGMIAGMIGAFVFLRR